MSIMHTSTIREEATRGQCLILHGLAGAFDHDYRGAEFALGEMSPDADDELKHFHDASRFRKLDYFLFQLKDEACQKHLASCLGEERAIQLAQLLVPFLEKCMERGGRGESLIDPSVLEPPERGADVALMLHEMADWMACSPNERNFPWPHVRDYTCC